jgi:hypothetical protein
MHNQIVPCSLHINHSSIEPIAKSLSSIHPAQATTTFVAPPLKQLNNVPKTPLQLLNYTRRPRSELHVRHQDFTSSIQARKE